MLPDEVLAQVQRPARYIGCEHNAVRKSAPEMAVRVALCYPELYEVGMSHIGLQILYTVLNARSDVWCERAFHPDADAAALMRRHGVPLWALESGDPLAELDVVGITLQHELTYPKVLSLLDLAHIPLRSRDRENGVPLVIGGGPGALNPEPVAEFFDALVVGDGEEVVEEIIEVVKQSRAAGAQRPAVLAALADLEGVYVPARHDPDAVRIRRRVVADLDAAPYPTRPPVPFVEIVHDRAQVEIARGCTRGCRFCQAGMIYRPVRERRPETVRRLAGEIIGNTGHDEVSLVGLNCPDYRGIEGLLDDLNADLAPRRVSVALPSLRIDTFSVSLAQKVQQVRKSGLTFAPEAGSQRLRDVINKGVTADDLLQTVKAAFEAGWLTLKLYFMIGLPTETDEDVLAIADLASQVTRVGRQTLGPRAGRMRVNVALSTLVPKPHTPLQWDGQIPLAEILRRQALVRDALRDRQVSLSWHRAEESVVEAALARGGRQAAKAVLAAYRISLTTGAALDRLSLKQWQEAFAEAGLDLAQEAERRFVPGDGLPWDHIDSGVSQEYLLGERERMVAGERTPDCREADCLGCGASALVACPPRACGVIG